MSDSEVIVVTTEPDTIVRVDTSTPVVTVTDLNRPADITVINADPVEVVLMDNTPQVSVNLGIDVNLGTAGADGIDGLNGINGIDGINGTNGINGINGFNGIDGTNGIDGIDGAADPTTVVEAISGILDIDSFAPELQGDLLLLRDLWTRVGRDVLDFLITNDIDSILQTAILQTDAQIDLIAVDIERIDKGFLANEGSITVNANAIGLRVTGLEFKTEKDFSVRDGRIDITEQDIGLHVLHLSDVDGIISQSQTDIKQTSDRITQEVVDREALADGQVRENTASIVLTAKALEVNIVNTNNVTGRVNTAEETLTANGKIISVLSKGLADNQYSLETVMYLTANTFGVTIQETADGIPYVAGFELILHPQWLVSEEGAEVTYLIGDKVSYSDGLVYLCILDHISAITNSPDSVDADTYWEVTESAKSDFNVKAEYFQIITPGGLVPVFTVDSVTEEVTINGDLVVQAIRSKDYDDVDPDPDKTWFYIDPETGKAVFNNITMTFSDDQDMTGVQDALGITGAPLLSWDGSQVITTSATIDTAASWVFDSPNGGGAMIEIEVDDAFAGKLHIALNGEILTTNTFGDQDFGDVGSALTTGFSDESAIYSYNDLSVGDQTYDLGGLS